MKSLMLFKPVGEHIGHFLAVFDVATRESSKDFKEFLLLTRPH